MNIRSQAISGGKWSTISSIISSLSQIIRVVILTRFLEKVDFGIVAIISFVFGFTQVFGDLGFSAVIMSKRDITRNEYNSLYWTQFLIFVSLYLTLSLSSPLVAQFYNEPSISYLMPISLLSLIFIGIGNLYDTILQKQLNFKLLAIRNIASALLSLILAFTLAKFGYGIYSLILSTLFQVFCVNILNFTIGQRSQKLKLHLSIKEIRPLIKIGMYQTFTRILDFFSSKIDVLIIGKLLGSESLGMYDLAKQLVLRAVDLVNTIVSIVMLPIFSLKQDDNNALQRYYRLIIRLLSFICFPIGIALCVFSKQIVLLLYGINYVDISPLVSIFSLLAMFTFFGRIADILAISKGRTELCFHNTIIRVIISPIIILIASLISLEMVAFSQVILGIIIFFVMKKLIVDKIISFSLIEYLNSFSGIGAISILICAIFYPIISNNLFEIKNSFFQIGIYGFFFLTTYILLIFIFLKNQTLELFQMIR